MNIGSELRAQMKGSPARSYANDMKVLIRSANAGKYPHLVAHCGEPELLDDRQPDSPGEPGLHLGTGRDLRKVTFAQDNRI